MSKKSSGILKFLAGIGIGAAAGVLFTSKTGEENRKELKKSIDKLINELKNIDAEEVKNNIESKINELSNSLEDLDREKVLKIAKDKAKNVEKMANELADYAISKGTPVLENAADSIRKKAIVITKEVLNKLEEK